MSDIKISSSKVSFQDEVDLAPISVKNPLAPIVDTMAPFTEDPFFLDTRKTNPLFGDPKLPFLPLISLASNNPFSDGDLEIARLQTVNANRDLLNMGIRLNQLDIVQSQKIRQQIHALRDAIMKEIIERRSTSNDLRTGQIASGGILLGLSVLGFAALVVTGNIPGALMFLGSLVGTANGVMGGMNGLNELEMTKIQGLVEDNQFLDQREYEKVSDRLADDQRTIQLLSSHVQTEVDIQRNRSQTRMF